MGRITAALGQDFEASSVRLLVEPTALTIQCDPEMLQQILVNLLLNSLAASKPGSLVSIRLVPDREQAILVVEDQGHGIAPDLLQRVFQPYVTGRPDGHGLGLAVVKRIVDEHGWSIDIQSEVGRGTRVCVRQIRILKKEAS